MAKGAVAGLIGGIVASFAMEKFQALLSGLSEKENSPDSDEEEEPATVKTAKLISEGLFDHRLSDEEKKTAGEAVHYAMGAATGFIYGIAAEVKPAATTGLGIPFGASVWLIADEGIVPAAGLSKPPAEYPLSNHLYALSSHMVYGLTTELVRSGLRKLL
ncbi:MAG TPA: DUF1440 domain-containing protein [Pyrinomonadaceae bacterium]|nr:DUF1440 domain-containing protein [Pyrinomonadaceae bacterium]